MNRRVVGVLACILLAAVIAGGLWFTTRNDSPSAEKASTTAQEFVEALSRGDSSALKRLSVTKNREVSDDEARGAITKFGGNGVTLKPGSVQSELVGHAIFTVTKGAHHWTFKESWDDDSEAFRVDIGQTF